MGSLLEVTGKLGLEGDLEISLQVWLSVNDFLELGLHFCTPHCLVVVEVGEITATGNGEVGQSNVVGSSDKLLSMASESGLEEISSLLVAFEPSLFKLIGSETTGESSSLGLVVAFLVEIKDGVNGPHGVGVGGVVAKLDGDSAGSSF